MIYKIGLSIFAGLLFLSAERLVRAEPPAPLAAARAAGKCDAGPNPHKLSKVAQKILHGDILSIGTDGRPGVLKGATVLLVCRGGRGKDEDHTWMEDCASTLVVCPAEPQSQKLVTDDVAGLNRYKSDGGEQLEKLGLSLFYLPAEGAALIRVIKESTEDCCGSSATGKSQSFYLVHGQSLRKVLAYDASLKSSSDEDDVPKNDFSTTLLAGPKSTRGLTDLVLTRIHTHSRKRTPVVRNYVWTGDYYDGCGAGCGDKQRCCNGNCEPASADQDSQCREGSARKPGSTESRDKTTSPH